MLGFLGNKGLTQKISLVPLVTILILETTISLKMLKYNGSRYDTIKTDGQMDYIPNSSLLDGNICLTISLSDLIKSETVEQGSNFIFILKYCNVQAIAMYESYHFCCDTMSNDN